MEEKSKQPEIKERKLKYTIKTFGCQMNVADSAEMEAHLIKRGFIFTPEREGADLILVNTCTIREMADHKAFSFVGKLKPWKEADASRVLVVTGCGVERDRKKFQKRFPYVDLLVGAKDIQSFPELLDRHLKNRFGRFDDIVPAGILDGNVEMSQMVTIMRGCNYNCTYCVVPTVRGREIYEPREKILGEVREKVAQGAREIWLLGQTVNSYKPPDPPTDDYDFSDLLTELDQVEGLKRIRFASPHPFYVTEKFARTMAACSKVCEHIHLPVQSGSNRILSAMKRNYTRETFLAALDLLRKHVPNISITTDFIVGFPGETEKEFKETLSLVEAAGLDSSFCFKYSPRPGTPAWELKDDVPNDEKNRRVNLLLELTEKEGREKARALVGSHQEVLISESKGEDIFRGKTKSSWRVRIKKPGLILGEVYEVGIKSTHSRELHGELV